MPNLAAKCCCGSCHYLGVLCDCSDPEAPEIMYFRCSDVDLYPTEAETIVFKDGTTGECYEVDLTQEPIVDGKPVGPFGTIAGAFETCELCCERPECFDVCAEGCANPLTVTWALTTWAVSFPWTSPDSFPTGCAFLNYTFSREHTVAGSATFAAIVPMGGGCTAELSNVDFTTTGSTLSYTHDGGAGCDTDVATYLDGLGIEYSLTCDTNCGIPYSSADMRLHITCINHDGRTIIGPSWGGSPFGYHPILLAEILALPSPVIVLGLELFPGLGPTGLPGRRFAGYWWQPDDTDVYIGGFMAAVGSLAGSGCIADTTFVIIPHIMDGFFSGGTGGFAQSIPITVTGAVTIA